LLLANSIDSAAAAAAEAEADDGVVQTVSGMAYMDMVRGAGTQTKHGDAVVVHYEGKINGFGADDPTFDSSYGRKTPFKFDLGAGKVRSTHVHVHAHAHTHTKTSDSS
jgi:FKBP-type peptidyl-prolyl cis-trans isomerase